MQSFHSVVKGSETSLRTGPWSDESLEMFKINVKGLRVCWCSSAYVSCLLIQVSVYETLHLLHVCVISTQLFCPWGNLVLIW